MQAEIVGVTSYADPRTGEISIVTSGNAGDGMEHHLPAVTGWNPEESVHPHVYQSSNAMREGQRRKSSRAVSFQMRNEKRSWDSLTPVNPLVPAANNREDRGKTALFCRARQVKCCRTQNSAYERAKCHRGAVRTPETHKPELRRVRSRIKRSVRSRFGLHTDHLHRVAEHDCRVNQRDYHLVAEKWNAFSGLHIKPVPDRRGTADEVRDRIGQRPEFLAGIEDKIMRAGNDTICNNS
jgi:hypothetical protein